MHRAMLLVASAIVLSGCPTISTLQRARPIGPGRHEVTVGVTGHGVNLAVTGSSDSSLLVLPSIDVMYRYGATNFFDFGISLQGWGRLGADFKFALVNTRPFALSIDPGVGGFFAKVSDVGGGYVQFDLPVLVDFQLGPYVALTFSGKYIGIYASANSDSSTASSYTSLIAGNMGIEFKIGRVFRIMPHGGVAYFFNDLKSSSDVTTVFYTGGVAFKFQFGGVRY